MEEQPGVREIDSVAGLRALADPVRLAILSAAAAERIRARREEVTREIAKAERGDVPVSVAIGFYRPRT